MNDEILMRDEYGNTHRAGRETVLVYLDETGEESLSDPKYPIFGIGACLVHAHRYNSNIIKPWLHLKDKEFGGADTSLHATDLRSPTPSQLAILNKFFSTCLFGRISTVLSDRTVFECDVDIVHLVARNLGMQIAKMISNLDCQEIVMIFEDNERLNAVYADYFDRYKFKREATEIPCKKVIMSKSEKEPGLEVADFVAHTAGTCVRARLTGKRTKEKERPDFECMFKAIDKRLTDFLDIVEVTNS